MAKAVESTRVRLAREAEAQSTVEAPLTIHPAFIMLGLGVGILAGAGAGGYVIDLSISNRHLASTQKALRADTLSDQRRADLLLDRQGYENAVFYDTAIAVVLGVVSVAGLATGTALLVASNVE